MFTKKLSVNMTQAQLETTLAALSANMAGLMKWKILRRGKASIEEVNAEIKNTQQAMKAIEKALRSAS